MTETKTIAKKELTQSERFTNMVVTEFTSGAGEVTLTNFQKRLAQNYFIVADAALEAAGRKAEEETYQSRLSARCMGECGHESTCFICSICRPCWLGPVAGQSC